MGPIAPSRLARRLTAVLPGARLQPTPLPLARGLRLWLIDDATERARQYTGPEIDRIWDEPPYWCFCWGSGQALAAHLLSAAPEIVRGKRVIDFGGGSGVAGVAAAQAGAEAVVACDIDEAAVESCEANAALNGVEMACVGDLDAAVAALDGKVDVLLAADVLYDRSNFPWLADFRRIASDVVIADSRVKQIDVAPYRRTHTIPCPTLPNLNEFDEFRDVGIYRAPGAPR
eukprot:TRINITY_DN12152_c0_g1_i1.p1 TRINITY_DN12152_c0_g1~~TRINITY_DN12152_c0_g1_i1.p1  ORF type:complete len:230 (+),score=51.01 TRINITY_DN12152_c0_g1_i1:53-742(+)